MAIFVFSVFGAFYVVLLFICFLASKIFINIVEQFLERSFLFLSTNENYVKKSKVCCLLCQFLLGGVLRDASLVSIEKLKRSYNSYLLAKKIRGVKGINRISITCSFLILLKDAEESLLNCNKNNILIYIERTCSFTRYDFYLQEYRISGLHKILGDSFV